MMEQGDKNINWKGDEASYNNIHGWLQKNWKKPNVCERCGRYKKLEWANVSGQYKRSDRTDWLALCRSCHVKMDWTPEKSLARSRSMKRYANSPEGRSSMTDRGMVGGKATASYPRQRNAKGQFTQLTIPTPLIAGA